MEDGFLYLFAMILVGFTVWFSRLTYRLNDALDDIGGRGDDLDEIKESVEIVAQILHKLPDLLPQFTMNTNPLQPIFEAFAKKLSGEQPLMTYEAPSQGSDGRFDGTKEKETNNTP